MEKNIHKKIQLGKVIVIMLTFDAGWETIFLRTSVHKRIMCRHEVPIYLNNNVLRMS